MKPRVVLSGVNFVEGGPLAVFQDALRALADHYLDHFDVIALVHRRDLFQIPGIRFIEFPEVKGSWLRRLRFEYRDCLALSQELAPTLWLAMHDITPNVAAPVRAVYCHNPAPFYRLGWEEARLDPTFALFSLFYKFLYAINIRNNNFVVVQQEWLREEFRRRFQPQEVVVAHPSIPLFESKQQASAQSPKRPYLFFYPAFPRSFKNCELLLEAMEVLEEPGTLSPFELWLTIDGTENRYASKLRHSYTHLKNVRWIGKQSRGRVEEMYDAADCLLFPSKLETWGMPISEWKRTGKPMLVANLPYAHETVGNYPAVAFLDAHDSSLWMNTMRGLVAGRQPLCEAQAREIAPPFAANWRELFEILLRDNTAAAVVGEPALPVGL